MAIEADPSFWQNRPDGGKAGLKAARAMALISYRNFKAYELTQNEIDSKLDTFKAATYQRYQGEKLSQRFDAYSYYSLTKTMDTHDIGRNREGIIKALSSINIPTLVISLKDDGLFPLEDQKLLANHLPNGIFRFIRSDYGHDGFLIESEKITRLVKKHRQFISAFNHNLRLKVKLT